MVLGDDYTILRNLLKTECSGKFRLAQDFLGTSTLSSAEVGSIICCQLGFENEVFSWNKHIISLSKS